MVEKDFDVGDSLSALEWSIYVMGNFSKVVSTFGGYCFSFGAQALVASIEDKCDHVKLASATYYPFCSVDALRKASRTARSVGKRIHLFLWEHEVLKAWFGRRLVPDPLR